MGVENHVSVDMNRCEEVIMTSVNAMVKHEGLFAFVDPQPEKPFIDLVKSRGPDCALNATFLVSTMVLGSKTEPFFKRLVIPEQFEKFSWLFDPKSVVAHSENEVNQACFAYFKPAGRQAEPIPQWLHNSRLLFEKYGGSVRGFFNANDNDALKIYDALVVRPRAKTSEKEIRRFGPKIAKLMLQWVREYKLHDLTNSDDVGLPVDFQLGRIMIQTDAVRLDQPVNSHFLAHRLLPLIFDNLGKKLKLRPEDISKAIWAIGSGGCARRLHDECPLEKMCTSLISSNKYDRKGLFDPNDVGRYE